MVVPFQDPTTNIISIVFNMVQFMVAFGGTLYFTTRGQAASDANAAARELVTYVIQGIFVVVIVMFVAGFSLKIWRCIKRRRLKKAGRQRAKELRVLHKARASISNPLFARKSAVLDVAVGGAGSEAGANGAPAAGATGGVGVRRERASRRATMLQMYAKKV